MVDEEHAAVGAEAGTREFVGADEIHPEVEGAPVAPEVIGGTRVINADSVGMPFGNAGADWLLLGAGVELRHTAYD